eukprot:TRINITY_DN3307_c0_g1_i1.p1 TRINITY_DN3307_c0_g1~~TRINITY_DN3307_c0_g1_i1.p1  ORF type:complete len:1318 (+),score=205.26 TRINITY_DN3307_c0_g1_i1:82-3954(+)
MRPPGGGAAQRRAGRGCRALALLLVGTLAVAQSSVQREDQLDGEGAWGEMEKESLPDGVAIPQNIVTITVPSVLVLALTIAVVAQMLLTGTARLPMLLLIMQFLAVLVTGISTWAVTYTAAVVTIENHASRLLMFAGLTAAARTTAELTHGAVTVEHMAAALKNGEIQGLAQGNHYPGTHRRLFDLADIASAESNSLKLVYIGTELGELHGVELLRHANGTFDGTVSVSTTVGPRRCAPGTQSTPTHPCPRVTELVCDSNADVWDTCRHRACAAPDGGCLLCLTQLTEVRDDPERCPGCTECEGWRPGALSEYVVPKDPNEWDVPHAGVIPGWCTVSTGAAWEKVGGLSVVQAQKLGGGLGRRWVGAPELINSSCAHYYDPRVRPWYSRVPGLRWSPLYEFVAQLGVVDMGITVAEAVPNPAYDGRSYTAGVPTGDLSRHPWLAVAAADFTFSSLSVSLRRLRPTRRSDILMADLGGLLVASSLPPAEMTRKRDTPDGLIVYEAVNVLGNTGWANSDLRDAFPRIARKYGSLRRAADQRAMLTAESGALLNQPIRPPGGLIWLMAVYMPYEDITEQSQEAATVALAVAVAICFGSGLLVSLVVAALLRPLHALSRSMHAVAHMDLDSPTPRGGITTEVSGMATDFAVMVASLKEYRSYLPQAVLGQVCGPEVDPPRDMVAILFSDIIGSTRLWEADPDAMAEALELHNSAVRNLIRIHNGYEVKTIGDAFMISFSDAADAVACGMAVQEGLLKVQWPASDYMCDHELWPLQYDPKGLVVWNGIAVRIGIGYGQTQDEENPVTKRCDYRGRAVNLASRLESSAPHGSVHISEQCYEAAKGLPRFKGTDFRRLPQQILKGIGAVQTYLATPPGLLQRIPYFLGAQGASVPTTTKANPLGNPSERGTVRGSVTPRHMRSDKRGSIRSSRASILEGSLVSVEGGRGPYPIAGLDRAQSSLSDLGSMREGSFVVVSRLDDACDALDHMRYWDDMARGAAAVVTGAMRTQGSVLSISGGEAHCCWNVINNCGTHEWMTLCFLNIVIPSVRFCSVGLAAGMLCRGSVGPARQRFYSVSGFPVLCARWAAFEAAMRQYSAVACYIGQPPTAVSGLMYPIDAWLTPGSAAQAVVAVEVPVGRYIREHLKREVASGSAEMVLCDSFSLDPVHAEMRALRKLFTDAVRGSADALTQLQDINEQHVAAGRDELAPGRYSVVLQALRAHLQSHPQGAEALRMAPFVTGTSKSNCVTPGYADIFPGIASIPHAEATSLRANSDSTLCMPIDQLPTAAFGGEAHS